MKRGRKENDGASLSLRSVKRLVASPLPFCSVVSSFNDRTENQRIVQLSTQFKLIEIKNINGKRVFIGFKSNNFPSCVSTFSMFLDVRNRKKDILQRRCTTYRFLKRLFVVQIYRSTSDCSLANISDIASRRYRFQLCVNRAYFTDGVTAAYPSTRLRYSTEQRFRPPRFLEHLPRSRSFGQMKGHKNISRR